MSVFPYAAVPMEARRVFVELVVQEAFRDGRIDKRDRALLKLVTRYLPLDREANARIVAQARALAAERADAPLPPDAARILNGAVAALGPGAADPHGVALLADLRRELGVSEAAAGSERRGREPALEVELSYAAGFLAGAAALSYFFYDYGRTVGFDGQGELFFGTLLTTVIEVFCLGLVLYLIQRGVWLAARVYCRNDPARWGDGDADVVEFRRSIRGLESQCQATLHATYQYLSHGIVGLVAFGAMCTIMDAETSFWRAFGLVILALFALHALMWLPGTVPILDASRRWARWYSRHVQRIFRAFGVWWIRLPEGRLPAMTLRYRVVTTITTIALFCTNQAFTLEPHVLLEKPVYSKARDTHAVLEIRHGGIRGPAGGNCHAFLLVDGKLRVPVEQVSFNHYVAAIPLANLKAGVHEIAVRPVIQRHTESGRQGFEEWPIEIRRSFYVIGDVLGG
jgi:hypothetical protein